MSTVSLDGSYEDACNSDELLSTRQQSSHGQQTQQWCDKNDEAVMQATAKVAAPITDANDPPTTCNYYKEWSSKYEEDMVAGTYNGPKHIANAFVELGLSPESRILDVLAGSGLVAELLRPHGYNNIDAIDGSKDMLAMAQKKELYKNYYVALLGAHRKAPVADATYDAVIASGAFGPGHLYSDTFGDIIRVVKPGGIIMWSMRSDYGATSPRFGHFDADVEKLVANGVWRHRVPRRDVDQYLLGSDGYIYTMQKI